MRKKSKNLLSLLGREKERIHSSLWGICYTSLQYKVLTVKKKEVLSKNYEGSVGSDVKRR